MAFLVIAFPDLSAEDRSFIQSFRVRHDPHHGLVDPHVTLVFAVNDLGYEEFAAHIRGISRDQARIPFTFRSAAIVQGVVDYRYYLFLVPEEGYAHLAGFHDRLYTGILSDDRRYDIPFIPHMTIGTMRSAQVCQELADELNRSGLAISGEIVTIDIVSDEKEKIRTIEKIPLTGT